MAAAAELVLPEQEFTYLAGQTDRPFQQFTGRWQAIRPNLAEMLKSCGSGRPLRIVDLGSCNGYFALHAAHRHPEADIVAVEGSVGIGNGTTGMAGSTRQILATDAVQTNLRWIQRLDLQNCFVAPEVWDYIKVCELASQKRPICDVMFLLSVVHHIDSVSAQQYASAGLSRRDGTLDLLGKLLTLSPRHFVELPNKPWLAHLYDEFGTARAILQAVAKASGLEWNFKGPIYSTDWFGLRETWVMESSARMLQVDVESCPFPLLYRGEEQDVGGDLADDVIGDLGSLGVYDDRQTDFADIGSSYAMDSAYARAGREAPQGRPGEALAAIGGAANLNIDSTYGISASDRQYRGSLVDPGLMLLSGGPCGPVEDKIGNALNAAPTALLVAHLTLRDAISEAEDLLKELHSGPMAAPRSAAVTTAPMGRAA